MNLKKITVIIILFIPSFFLHAMTLKSDDVKNKRSLQSAQVFNQWGCTGENQSPQLTWSNVPAGTKSFAVTMYDPDAPTGSGWWHWVVINIPKDIRSLKVNAGAEGGKGLPKGASMVMNDFSFKGFGGACPPPGAKLHNYTITVYALDVEKIDIPVNATAALAGYHIHSHIIGKAEIVAPSNTRN